MKAHFEYWAVRVIADCEGRTTRDKAVFKTEREALRYAESDQGMDMYGKRGDVVRRGLDLCEFAEDAGATTWVKKEARDKQEAFLASLTDEERKALAR